MRQADGPKKIRKKLCYFGETANDPNPITKEFRKALDERELHKPGLGFYTLRHVFRTVAGESRYQPAVNSIMGHADESMAAVYRERIGDERLRAAADHVRAWLFSNKAGKNAPRAVTSSRQAKKKPERKSAPRSRQVDQGRIAAQVVPTSPLKGSALRLVS